MAGKDVQPQLGSRQDYRESEAAGAKSGPWPRTQTCAGRAAEGRVQLLLVERIRAEVSQDKVDAAGGDNSGEHEECGVDTGQELFYTVHDFMTQQT